MQGRILLLFLVIFSGVQVFSQHKISLEDWTQYKFRNIGPAGMSGRITAIDVDPLNDSRIFLGSASGGVWLSENGGISFTPIFDEQPDLAIGAIKINPKNPQHIWVGTGEGNPRNSLNTGNGIYKSIDGGKSWKYMGLMKTKAIHRIIIHKENPDVVLVAAMGSPWGPNEERGVFKTTDGGLTWKKVLYTNASSGAAELITDPLNPDKLIAAMWEHERKPWFFNSGGPGSGIYTSMDAGDTWSKIESKDGIPSGNLGRVGLAIAASDPRIVYALIEAKENGLYKSEDGGRKWKLVQSKDIGGRPFYYSEIYVDPKNENRIYNVHTYLSRSDDGGKTFYNIADYGNAVHPDHHALWIHPENPAFIIDGNDGGAAISRDMGNSWMFLPNLPVGQFYHVNIDNEIPYNVYGGMQDNGSWAGPSAVLKPGGIRNTDFQELYFGDGFDVVPFPDDARYGYAMSQGGNVAFYDRKTGMNRFVKPNHPDGTALRFNWNAAIAQDPFRSCGIYFGSQFLHYSDDCGKNWKLLSPDLTTNDSTKQDIRKTGGLTPDATGAETHTTILAIAPSPLDKNVIWVGTDDGNLQLTVDGGKSWENLNDRLKGLPDNAWIPQIHASSYHPGEAWVVANNYRMNDYTPYAYYTRDYGKSWKRIADETQIKSFILSIIQDTEIPELLFLGTDAGLYVSFNKGEDWQLWNKGFPQVQVTDMKINKAEGDLIIATFGRALWILDDLNPLRALAANKFHEKDMLKIFGGGDFYDWHYSSYEGVRFFAQGDFTGENETKNQVALYYWYNAEKKDKEGKSDVQSKDKKSDKLKIYWLNEKGDTIRRQSAIPKKGIQKIYWSMDEDGVRFPSRREMEKDADLPGGISVMPGNYKCVISINDQKDSTYAVVKPDPRVEFDKEKSQAAYDKRKSFQKNIKQAATSYDWLKNCRKHLKVAESLKSFQSDTLKNKIEKWNKDLAASLDSLENLFMLPESTKGIAYDDDKINSKIWAAQSYLSTADGQPSDNVDLAVKEAEQAIMKAIEQIKKFEKEKWMLYQAELEAASIRLFPEMKTPE